MAKKTVTVQMVKARVQQHSTMVGDEEVITRHIVFDGAFVTIGDRSFMVDEGLGIGRQRFSMADGNGPVAHGWHLHGEEWQSAKHLQGKLMDHISDLQDKIRWAENDLGAVEKWLEDHWQKGLPGRMVREDRILYDDGWGEEPPPNMDEDQTYRWFRERRYHRYIICGCGEILYIPDGMTNDCEACGRLYNGSGQELAPPSQWDDEDRYDSFGPQSRDDY